MKYLCMIFYDERKLAALFSQEFDTLTDESLAYDDVLRRNGHFLAAQALQSVTAATTVRTSNGRISVTDGPFAETTEQIGGFIRIEAKDLNEAIQIAAAIPSARLGGVELRPVEELKPAEHVSSQ